MTLFKKIGFCTLLLGLISCKGLVDDINDVDPNKISGVTGDKIFTGIQIADVASQYGLQALIAAVWSGQLTGQGHNFQTFQNYDYNSNTSNLQWTNAYQGVLKQARILRGGISVPNRDFFYGASSILEADAMGTMCSLFGSIPYSQAATEIAEPVYDKQSEVFSSLQTLLDQAIKLLEKSKATKGITVDIFFDGNSEKWKKAAYTLKSRFYLETRAYSKVIENCEAGISKADETMYYNPPNTIGTGDLNLIHATINGSQKGLIGVGKSHLRDLLIASSQTSRNNTKTDESSRVSYYYSGENNVDVNIEGFAKPDAPMPIVSWEENILNWAEAAARLKMFDLALSKLNEHRKNLREGVYFTVNTAKYEDYVESDFENGGIENKDGLAKEDALLREILEERYVTFFVRMLVFNDVRRCRKDAQEVQVKIPPNSGNKLPERFLYPARGVNTNPNVPSEGVGIFDKTDLNK